MQKASSGSPAGGGRVERRRAATRQNLVGAARSLIAEGGLELLKIGDITERADVGFGSFYNHFSDKDQIVGAVLEVMVDDFARALTILTEGVEDPAERVSLTHRYFVRLAADDAASGWVVVRLEVSHGLLGIVFAGDLRHDVEAGNRAGRFSASDVDASLAAAAGALAAAMRRVLGGEATGAADVIHSELVLRMLGVSVQDAKTVSTLAFPVDSTK